MSTVEGAPERPAERLRRLGEPRSLAIVGICLGAFGFWLSLPPFTLRNVAVPAAPSSGPMTMTSGMRF